MTMADPIADMITRIRNGGRAGHSEVSMASSRMKCRIAKVLKDEGYIRDYSVSDDKIHPTLTIVLKYYNGQPVIETITRISKPSRRVYRGIDDLPVISGGLGVAIVSTSKGVLTAKAAKAAGIGGEVLCSVN